MDGDKNRSWRVIARFAAVAAFVCVLPTIRSCGRVALGFPTVAVTNVGEDSSAFRFPNLAVNVLSIGLIAFALLIAYRRAKKEPWKSIFRWGLRSFAIYQALTAIGFALVYPLFAKSENGSLGSYFFAGYVYLVYPFFHLLKPLPRLVPAAVSSSGLFGDELDVPVRLWWIATSLAWFCAGAASRLVRNAIARRRAARKDRAADVSDGGTVSWPGDDAAAPKGPGA